MTPTPDRAMSALDAPPIAKGVAEQPGTTRPPGLVNLLVYLFFIKYAGRTHKPLPVGLLLEHDQVLPLAGGVEVIHSPSHSAGHICSHVMSLTYSTIKEDRTLAQQSISRVAEYPFERAVFRHGNALQERASQQLKAAFAAS